MSERLGGVRQFFAGGQYLWHGLRWLARHPGLMVLGAVPPLVVGALFLTLIGFLLFQTPELVAWLTPFADGWAAWLTSALRVLLGAVIVGGAVVLAVLSFSAISLAIGTPVYDAIAAAVDREYGLPDEVHPTSMWQSLTNTLKLLLIAMPIAVGVFLVSLIPFVGSILGAVLGAVAGGRALAMDLTATSMDARGLTVAERRAVLRGARWTTMGFGVCAYVLFLVPVIAVIAMPSATAGGALLTRHLRGEPSD